MAIKKNETGTWVLDRTEIPGEVRQEVEIFDTTLRDGEQGGVTFKGDSKLKIARFLADTGGQYHRGWISQFNPPWNSIR